MAARAMFIVLFIGFSEAFNIVSKGPSPYRKTSVSTPAEIPSNEASKLATVFKQFDKDGNGFLDKTELKSAFIAAGYPATDDQIHHSFSILDRNHDGKISLDEFSAMAQQNMMPALAQAFMRDMDHTFEASGEFQLEGAQYRRDKLLAEKNPQAYCANRCLASGYCEVFEDIYEMTTSQVKRFCEKCSGNDECELAYA